MSHSTTIAEVSFAHCIFNASGPKCVTEEDLKAIGQSGSSAIMIKSCTVEPRAGNPEPRYHDLPHGSINSMGLPNLGHEEYIKIIPRLQFGKPVIVSVSGLTHTDNVRIITAMNNVQLDLIELNLSCPNLPGKPQTGYDVEQSDKLLTDVLKVCRHPLGVKLPPYFDFVHFEQMASMLRKHNIAFITCINSIGNALYIDAETETAVIKPKGGFGGLGGEYIKPTALANVRKFSELLPDVDIIGVGGITNGTDVFEFVLAGAKAVQLGTVVMQEGLGCFARIEKEFNEIMQRKGYREIAEVRGKLRTL